MLIHSPKELAIAFVNQRKKLKLSQHEVGSLVGLKQQTVSEFEIKPESTKVDTLFRMLSAVNLEIKIITKDVAETKQHWKEEW